ncbi:MAG: hypothetical protein Kow0025_08510 [Thermodesulfovibrionales bacterium]
MRGGMSRRQGSTKKLTASGTWPKAAQSLGVTYRNGGKSFIIKEFWKYGEKFPKEKVEIFPERGL